MRSIKTQNNNSDNSKSKLTTGNLSINLRLPEEKIKGIGEREGATVDHDGRRGCFNAGCSVVVYMK